MNILTKTIATLTVAATAFAPMATSTASAGERGFRHDNHGGFRACSPRDPRCGRKQVRNHGFQKKHRGKKRHGISGGDAAGIAILGIIGGAIIGSAIQNQNKQRAARTYQNPNRYPAAPSRSEPRVITLNGSLEPWSAGWYDYCENRYRSFNARKGTYRGYDGKDHFCVAR